jgi:CRISPR/Cas system CMR subunit Cmr6 (Cas7 group RAMP superfamily)
MTPTDYWTECITQAAEDCNLSLTKEQLDCLVETVKLSHENYDQAFYSPPAIDFISEIEREFEERLKKEQAEHEEYVKNSEIAIKKALSVKIDDRVAIEKDGEVYHYCGRTTRIQ